MIVYNELLYTTGAKIARIKYGVRGKYPFRKHIAKHGFPEEAIEKVNDFIRDFKATILRNHQNPDETVKTIKIYRLTPNDAQIALTCNHRDIGKLATFDKDFKRVPWLRIML